MKILDILELSRHNKILAILAPNSIEAKLLFDRFLCSKIEGLRIINANTLEINDSRLIFVTPDSAHKVKATHFVVEFSDSIPDDTFLRLPPSDLTFAPCEIL